MVDDSERDPARRARVPAEARRAQIIEAARRTFAAGGYDGTSTAAIAAAAGCAEPVLYRHFPSKITLLREVLERIRTTTVGPAVAAAPPGAHALLATVLADDEMQRDLAIVVSAISVAHRDPDVADVLVGTFAGVRTMLAAAVAAARADGRIRTDADPEEVAWLWHGLLLAATLRRSVRRDGVAEGAVGAARLLDEVLAPG